IHAGIGAITEGDVMMASASKGIVFGFHVEENVHVSRLAERENVDIMKYKVIYKLIDDITDLLAGLIEPEIVEIEIGEAEVKQIFFSSKKELILGCKIVKGVAQSKLHVKIMRGEEQVGKGYINSLRSKEETVDEIKVNQECGIKLETHDKVEEGDRVVFTKKEKRTRKLST
ncbi:translation initiation factor IF-2, partial [Patescibacteria group bacterium]|nr:translation initiation factor IF-2 [Patescibacteria group bacterium]